MIAELQPPLMDSQPIGAFIAAMYAVQRHRSSTSGPSLVEQAVSQLLAAEAQLVEALRCTFPAGMGIDLLLQQGDEGGLFMAVPGSVVGVVSTADPMQRVVLYVRVETTGRVYEVPLESIIGQVALASS